jgi:hypothetical protein
MPSSLCTCGSKNMTKRFSACAQNRTKTRESVRNITQRARVQDGSEIESVEALCERLSCGRKVKTINLHGHTIQQPASAPPQDLSSAWRKVALWPVQVRCISSFSLFVLVSKRFFRCVSCRHQPSRVAECSGQFCRCHPSSTSIFMIIPFELIITFDSLLHVGKSGAIETCAPTLGDCTGATFACTGALATQCH